MGQIKLGRAVMAVPLIIVAAIVGTPPAGAVPGDPLDGCITSFGQQLCDGPIREDGSWKRCLFSPGPFAQPVVNCFIVPGVNQIPPFPLGQPQYHIDS